MKRVVYILLIGGLLLATWAKAQQTTYVLVHGAWGGGWSFKKTDSLLRLQGNIVYRPTLSGLGERVHLASPEIDLSMHIADVVNTILFENLHDVVLLGHSYGGMVVTGVADSIPERVRQLIYLDAFVPEDGQSVATAHGQESPGGEMPSKDGLVYPFWNTDGQGFPRDVPQPAKTFSQPLVLKNKNRLEIPTTYILTYEGEDPEKDAFAFFASRAKGYGWKIIHMQADHNPQMTMPDKLAQLLAEVGDEN
ncbi:alpha/beta fold hydrolase [Parapedobacter koreensis]|uniref:Pimeloyl-ACP methyl ester carboxylesterase n=1 Tax=Parapedobacter koreensis TaxID=332977 RepID=A0A1H7Q550_9SPHI|nr:alpha/beta hydrolase [Parapedobacter koreensis]SEL43123.1 Pimeloyl-ACP methyl ester carboxylesterase [Parapedobacter koreensis]